MSKRAKKNESSHPSDQEKIAKLLASRFAGDTLQILTERLGSLISMVGYDQVSKIVRIGFDIASRYSMRSTVTFLENSPEILHSVGLKNLVQLANTAREMTRHSERAAVRLIKETPGIAHRAGFAAFLDISRVACLIAKHDGGAAVSFIKDISQRAHAPVGRGLSALTRVADLMKKDEGETVVALFKSAPNLIEQLPPHNTETPITSVYNLARNTAQTSVCVAVCLVETSPMLIERVGIEGLEKVARMVTDTAEHDDMAAVSLLTHSPSLIDLLGMNGFVQIAKNTHETALHDSTAAAQCISIAPEVMGRLKELSGRKILSTAYEICSKTSVHDSAAAIRFLESTPAVVSRLLSLGGPQLPIDVANHCAVLVDESWHAALSLFEQSPILADKVGSYGMESIAHMTHRLARKDGALAASFINKGLGFIDEYGLESYIAFGEHGITLADKSSKKAFSFLHGESTEYASFLSGVTKGLALNSVKRVLTNYIAAIAGRPIEISAGQRSSCDGEKLYLPGNIDAFGDNRQNFAVYKMLATHEVAHHMYGSFDLDLESVFDAFPMPLLIRDLVNILEDYRIEQRLNTAFPALGKQIKKMGRVTISKGEKGEGAARKCDKTAVVTAMGQTLLSGEKRASLSKPLEDHLASIIKMSRPLNDRSCHIHDTVDIASRIYSHIDENLNGPYQPVELFSPVLDQSLVEAATGKTGKAAQKIARKIQEGADLAETPIVLERDDRETGDGKASKPLPPDKKTQDAILRLLRNLEESGIDLEGLADEMDGLGSGKAVERHLNDLSALMGKKKEQDPDPHVYLYPEWGSDIDDYRLSWARLREVQQVGTSMGFYDHTRSIHAGLVRKVRRDFQMLRPMALQKFKRQPYGDEIDFDAAVAYFIDRRLKTSPSEMLYTRSDKSRRDVAVGFLVDMSASTKGQTIQCEKEALIIMAEALTQVGDTFAIWGFTDTLDALGQVETIFSITKDFEEPYADKVKGKISAMSSKDGNRDGTAIRHAVSKLKTRHEATRILIILSDSQPAYEDRQYGIEDTRMALKEARAAGIEAFCITVDMASPEYLLRMYSHSNWTCIKDVTKLPEKITRIYTTLTA